MRDKIMILMYDLSKVIYSKYFKQNEAWEYTTRELLEYPQYTLGYELGKFLQKNSFELYPKVESHDIYHILLGFGTDVFEEIAMQYYLLGNGKRSLYMYSVVTIGAILYPDYWYFFKNAFQQGKSRVQCFNFDFKTLLNTSYSSISRKVQKTKSYPQLC